MSELKKIALRAVVGSLNPQEPGQLLVGSSKRNSGSIFGVSVWRGSVVAWQSSMNMNMAVEQAETFIAKGRTLTLEV